MGSVKSYNIRGIDVTNPYGDGLMFLQDAVITDSRVSQRKKYPVNTFSYATSHNSIASIIDPTIEGYTGYACSMGYTGSTYKTIFWNSVLGLSAYSKLYAVAGDETTQVGGTEANVIDFRRVARLNNEAIFSGNNIAPFYNEAPVGCMAWGGNTKTTVLSSTTSTRTATTTNNSNTITFSGAVSGLDGNWCGAYIYLSGHPNRMFRITKVTSTSSINIDTAIDTGSAGQTWCIQPISFVGAPSNIFYKSDGSSVNNVVACYVESHLDRAWAGIVYDSDGRTQWHRVLYSGVLSDISSYHKGYTYWNSSSYIDVAPSVGSRIMGLYSWGDSLIVFKDRGICVIRGVVANADPTKFGARVDVLSTEIECRNSMNICKTSNGIFLFSNGCAYLVTDTSIDRVDTKIKGILDDDGTRIERCFFWDNKVYCRTYGTVSEIPDGCTKEVYQYLVFDLERGEWSYRTIRKSLAPGAMASVYNGDGTSSWLGMPASSSATQTIAYKGREGDDNFGMSVVPVGTVATTTDVPLFAMITNGIVPNDNYPGYVRPVTVHVMHNSAATTNIRVASVPSYSTTLSSDFDLINEIIEGGYSSTKLSEYALGDSSSGSTYWQRFNLSGAEPSTMLNIVIGRYQSPADEDLYYDPVDIYGLAIEYESADRQEY